MTVSQETSPILPVQSLEEGTTQEVGFVDPLKVVWETFGFQFGSPIPCTPMCRRDDGRARDSRGRFMKVATGRGTPSSSDILENGGDA